VTVIVRLVGLPEEPDIIGVDRPERPRRWRALAGNRRFQLAGLVALAAAVAIVVTIAPWSQPPRSTPAVTAANVTNASSTAGPGAFASGLADGQRWRLALRNVATDGNSCLPAVVLDGKYGDVLFPGEDLWSTPVGMPSVITNEPDAPRDASFAFVQVPATIRQLRVAIGSATLTLAPHTERLCGRTFRLAGFGFPSTAPVTIMRMTAAVAYTLPASLVQPARGAPDYTAWQNLDEGGGWGKVVVIGRADIRDAVYGITVDVGEHGQCFAISKNAQPFIGYGLYCTPVSADISYAPVIVIRLAGVGLAFVVPLTAQVRLMTATLPGGATVRATPVDVGGLVYAALFTTTGPTRLTCYGAGGVVIRSVRWDPALPG
jgi:hypothetical protein